MKSTTRGFLISIIGLILCSVGLITDESTRYILLPFIILLVAYQIYNVLGVERDIYVIPSTFPSVGDIKKIDFEKSDNGDNYDNE